MTIHPEIRRYPFGALAALEADPCYSTLRDQGPVRVQLPYGVPAWLVTRYADVKLVLADRRFSRAASVGPDEPRMLPMVQRANLILNQDPPEHSRIRQLVAKAFTKRGVRRLRPWTQRIVDDLLDKLEKHGAPADLVAMLAVPLPAMVIAGLLGVPSQDRDHFVGLTGLLVSASLAEQTDEQIAGAGKALWSYLAGLVALRRSEPGDDLVSTLIQARDAGHRLAEDELVALCLTLVIAGHDATSMQIGNFTYLLLTNPAHWHGLQRDPALIEPAVEELMRFSPLGISTAFPRVATQDVVLGDVLVRAGDAVVVALTAANRDEAVFDRAELLDFSRRANSHLGFGHGIHRCLGAQLARMELQAVFGGLVRRFPGLRLATSPDAVPWSASALARSARELLVTW